MVLISKNVGCLPICSSLFLCLLGVFYDFFHMGFKHSSVRFMPSIFFSFFAFINATHL